MQHEALAGLAARVGVEVLRFLARSERRQAERLRFTALEQAGTVRAGQETDLGRKRADVEVAAAVDALLLVEDGDAERLLLDVVERLRNLERRGVGVLGEDGLLHLGLQRADGLATGGLGRVVDGGLNAVARDLIGDFLDLVANGEQRHDALFLARVLGEVALGLDDLLDEADGRNGQRLDELVLGQFLGLALDHDDLVIGADVNEVQVAEFTLGVGGIDDELAVDPADAHRAHGAAEGDVRDAQRRRRAVDGEHVGIVFTVGAQERGDDLGVVEIALREQGPQRPVGHAAGEDFLFAGAALTAEIAAGDLAHGGGFLAVFDGQRKPVLAFLDAGGADGRDEDDGVAGADGDGAVREAGDFAGFKGDGSGADKRRGGMIHG